MKNQIASSIEQSRRLLSCGVDPNTADMYWCFFLETEPFLCLGEIPVDNETGEMMNEGDIPAWSLSALCSLLPKRIKTNNACLTIVADYNDWNVGYEYDSLIGRGIETVKSFNAHSLIEACVQMIEWLTEHNYPLNKIEE